MFDTGIVDEKTCLKVVRTIQNQVHVADHPLNVIRVDVGHDGFHFHLRVHLPQLFGSGDRLGQVPGDVLLVEENLPLQVVHFDVITVYDPDPAYSGSHQPAGDDRPQGSTTDDLHRRHQESFLPGDPDLRKESLP